MGDGTNEYKTDPKEAFKDSKKININTNKEISVASTSCMIKSMENMLSEIRESNLKALENKIVDDLPNFKECEMFIVTKNNKIKKIDTFKYIYYIELVIF